MERQRRTEQHFPPGVTQAVASTWTPGVTMRHRRLIRSTTATQIAATKNVRVSLDLFVSRPHFLHTRTLLLLV